MKITQDVINDLLPLYAAGEASPDTVSLIEEYLVVHPELAQTIRDLRAEALPEISVPLNPNKEKETLNMTKKLLRLKSTLMALAIFLSLTILSFRGSNGHITWSFLQDTPTSAIVLLIFAAVASWAGFFHVARRLSHTGL